MTSTSPLAMFNIPIVTIKEGILAYTWILPFARPQRAPAPIAITMAAAIGKPSFRLIVTIIPERAAILPTLKSISPEIRTNVIPIPIIAVILTCRITLIKLSGVKKTGFNIVRPTTRIAKMPSIAMSFQFLLFSVLFFSIFFSSGSIVHDLFLRELIF